MLGNEKNVQIRFLVSESNLLSLKQLSVILKAKVIVLLAESAYSSQRLVKNKKLQFGRS